MLERVHMRSSSSHQCATLRCFIVELNCNRKASADKGESVMKGQAAIARGTKDKSFGVEQGIRLDLEEAIGEKQLGTRKVKEALGKEVWCRCAI